MTESEVLQGTIGAVVYQNYENGYAVLRLKCEDGQTITVVGTIPLPVVGEQLMVTGRWSSHSSYGRQFDAEFLERLMPKSAADIMGFLSSRVIKGIGPKIAARIVGHFGENTLHIMERQPERLAEVPGISAAKAAAIGEAFTQQMGMRQLMEFFALHHLPAELAVRTYRLYGDAAVDMLYDDPYLLTEEGLDAPFGAVDQFAIDLGIFGDDPRRVNAGILFELHYNLSAGHSFLPEEKLIAATCQLLSVGENTVRNSMQELMEAERLVRDHLAGIDIVYLPGLYRAEIACTQQLSAFAQNRFPAPRNLSKLVKRASADKGIAYSAQQEEAIHAAATTGLLMITGGPGTGKSATRFCVK